MPPRANPLARPKHTANRLSAVYIGSGQPQTPPNNINTPPDGASESIPDLPEPPSPGASSSGSGLPSPPATNSTGSGSTGDPQSIAIRERPLSFNSSSSGGSGNVGIRDLTFNTMFKNGNSRTLHRSTSSISSTTSERIADSADVDDEDDNNDNDSHNNDDDTARLDLRYPRATAATASNENILALQRVKNLTQRNRMALDKLSAYPRADTRSPAPSHTSHTSSSASGSSNTSRLSRRPLSSHAPPEPQLSGSETERESTSFHSNSNSTSSFHSHSNTSQSHLRTVSQHQPRTQTPPTPHRIRTRLPSAPSSPLKALARANNNNNTTTSSTSSNGSSPSRARKRVSIAVMDDRERDVYGPGGAVRARSSLALVNRETERDRGDITQSAMAAVASSRRRNSPTGAARRRGALPLEFRADLGQGRMSTEPEPMTPYRATQTNNAHNRNNTHTYIIPVSASTSTSSSTFSHTPASSSSSSSFANTSASGSGSGSNHLTRSATVRERRGQQKWASEDLGGPLSASTASSSSASYITGDRHQERGEYTRDRRESVMGMGEYRERRQSLRTGSAESALAHGSGGRSFFAEGLRAAGLSPSKSKAGRVSLGGARLGGGGGGGDVFTREHEDDYDDEVDGRAGRTRAGTLVGSRTAGGGGLAARAATSMADYRYLGRGDVDDDDDDVGVGTRRELRGSKSAFPLRDEQKQRERETSLTRERERERDMDRAASSMSRYTPARAPQERYASPFGSKRYNSAVGPGAVVQAPTPTQEHTRLMMESLAMFEGHIVRLGLAGSGGGGGGGGSGLGGGGGGNELVRTAQSVAGAAEKLNAMLRYGVSRALEEQVDAEVEEGEGKAGAREMAEVWRRVGGEYREGQRVSDELVRGLTGLLLGVGKVVRDLAGSGGEGQHGRSVSLDEEGLGAAGRRTRGSMSPDVGTGGGGGGGSNGGGGSTGGGSGSGRRSVESRRSWDPTAEALRDDASRRLSARAESVLGATRPPSSFNTLRDQRRVSPQLAPPPTGPRNSTDTPSMRRLFTPREQREQQLDAHYAKAAMNQADSQETLYADYEPSPTPVSRHQNQTTLDRSRTLPSLSIPKPLPTLPSESLRRSQTTANKAMPPPSSTVRDRNRRNVSVASISTVRANTTFPASLTTPSSATTALTAHTVSTSHTPDRTAFPSLNRTDSDRSARSTVTFSRPSTVSVSALNGLQQQHLEHQRKRTGSGASSGAEPSTSVPPQRPHIPSSSETAHDARRKTLGARTPRASLDSAMEASGSGSKTATVHAADRSAAVALGVGAGGMLPPMNTARRERRRTVTDIWPRD